MGMIAKAKNKVMSMKNKGSNFVAKKLNAGKSMMTIPVKPGKTPVRLGKSMFPTQALEQVGNQLKLQKEM